MAQWLCRNDTSSLFDDLQPYFYCAICGAGLENWSNMYWFIGEGDLYVRTYYVTRWDTTVLWYAQCDACMDRWVHRIAHRTAHWFRCEEDRIVHMTVHGFRCEEDNNHASDSDNNHASDSGNNHAPVSSASTSSSPPLVPRRRPRNGCN